MKGVELRMTTRESVRVFALSGEIDLLNCDEVGRDLRTGALSSGAGVVVDLSAIRYVDSTGVRTLFMLAREMERSRVQWAVVVPEASPILRLFKVTTFDEVVPILPSVDEAVSGLTSPGSAIRKDG